EHQGGQAEERQSEAPHAGRSALDEVAKYGPRHAEAAPRQQQGTQPRAAPVAQGAGPDLDGSAAAEAARGHPLGPSWRGRAHATSSRAAWRGATGSGVWTRCAARASELATRPPRRPP